MDLLGGVLREFDIAIPLAPLLDQMDALTGMMLDIDKRLDASAH